MALSNSIPTFPLSYPRVLLISHLKRCIFPTKVCVSSSFTNMSRSGVAALIRSSDLNDLDLNEGKNEAGETSGTPQKISYFCIA